MVNLSKLARRKLGEILIEEGLLKEDQLQDALQRQKTTAELLGESLIKLNFVTETDIACALAKQFGLPYLDAAQYQIQKDVLELLPAETMLQNQFILLDKIGTALIVAVAGAINIDVFESLERRTGSQLFLYVSTASQVLAALRKHVSVPAGSK